MMTIHAQIKQRRKALGLSQTRLAEEVSRLEGLEKPLSWQTVQQWENGKSAPRHKRLEHVAAVLQTSVDKLVGGTPADEPSATGIGTEEQPANPLASSVTEDPSRATTATVESLPAAFYRVRNVRVVWVVGQTQGGMPERIWGDGDYPVGATDEFAEVSTIDPNAFVARVVGLSMVPRYQPGEFALIEPNVEPHLEDDVLVRLATGETLLKRLLSRRGGIRLGSYNSPEVLSFREDEITWMYYVAHSIPARRIKHRAQNDLYAGPERRKRDLPVPIDRRRGPAEDNYDGEIVRVPFGAQRKANGER